MKKGKCLPIILICVMMIFSACGGSNQQEHETNDTIEKQTMEVVQGVEQTSESSKETEADSVIETTTESNTEYVSEPESTVVLDESVFTKCIEEIVIPVPEMVNGVPMVEAGQVSDTEMYLVYQTANEDTLASYLKLCSLCGLQSYLMDQNDTATQYAILKPGQSYAGMVVLDHTDDFLYILTDMNIMGYETAELEYMMEYYLQDIVLPTEMGTNAMPQFYASVNVAPYYQGVVGEISYVFDNASCWTELYSDIDYKTLWQYMNDMLVCGFDIWLDMVRFDDNNVLDKSVIHFSNGDAEVIVVYDAADKNASVYYKPGVSYNLLDGDDYAKYIPQR